MRRATFAAALAALVTAAAAVEAQPYPEPVVTYVVRRGDTCRQVALRAWRDPERVDLVHRYNNLGAALPHVLTPGASLVLPRAAGPREPDARVTRVAGTVTRVRTRPPSEQAARPQMDLARGDRISTRTQSNAQVTFRDQSFLRLQENSTVLIYGPTRARAQTLEVAPARVQLQSGTLEAGLLSLARARDLTVTTTGREQVTLRASEASVTFVPPRRATPRARVRAAPGSTTVSVFRGTAQARAGGRALTVREGTAVTLVPGRPPSAVRLLLPAPAWSGGAADLLALAGAPSPELHWDALPGAVGWRLDVAGDDLFVQAVASVPEGGALRAWQPASLPAGRYWVRVRGVDAEGFVGMPSAPRVVQLVAVTTPGADVTPEGRVRLHRGATGEPDALALAGADGVQVNGAPYDGAVRVPAAGRVTLALPARAGATAPPLGLDVEVVDPRAEVTAPREPVAHDATETHVSVTLRAPDGAAYEGPAPRASVANGWATAVRASGAGAYDVVIRPPPGRRPEAVDVALVAAWGAPLGNVTVRFAPAPVAAPVIAPAPRPAPAPAPPAPGRYQGLGVRFWAWYTPPGLVGLFATETSGAWKGALSFTSGAEQTFTTGLEYTLRRDNVDVVLGLQYTGLGAQAGYFHGTSESEYNTERVESRLWAVYFNVLFLWRARLASWVEFQYGAGVGLGYVGGDLYRTQVYASGGGYAECAGGGDDARYCVNTNDHYLRADGTRYSEPRWTDAASGSLPPLVPWISLPHLALHLRPHRRFDVRVDAGFALLGFYSGLAAHVTFD